MIPCLGLNPRKRPYISQHINLPFNRIFRHNPRFNYTYRIIQSLKNQRLCYHFIHILSLHPSFLRCIILPLSPMRVH